uniref:Uncharacterized protein n=2 Tax=Chrysotila carterae TaxID=13221 RepID=A0A7S4B9Y7_CHRCT|mmetsp:Transcript_30054/g.65824  ORF Transcript_30054/g.65824 Transcript_30054/m.65824 type:complete len:162 (+) Transcript_30054:517-1002(+)
MQLLNSGLRQPDDAAGYLQCVSALTTALERCLERPRGHEADEAPSVPQWFAEAVGAQLPLLIRVRLDSAAAPLHEASTASLFYACAACAPCMQPRRSLEQLAAEQFFSQLLQGALVPQTHAEALCTRFVTAAPRELPSFAIATATLVNDVLVLWKIHHSGF